MTKAGDGALERSSPDAGFRRLDITKHLIGLRSASQSPKGPHSSTGSAQERALNAPRMGDDESGATWEGSEHLVLREGDQTITMDRSKQTWNSRFDRDKLW